MTGAHRHTLSSGILLALGAAALFGASTPAAKRLLDGIAPQMLAGLLYLGMGLGLGAFALLVRRRSEAPLRWRQAGWIAAMVISGGIAGPLLLMLGLQSMPASASALLLNLEGLFTLVIAWLVYRENVDLRIGLGAAAILLGGLLLSWQPGNGGFGSGAGLIAAACLCWAIDNNLTRQLSTADPVQIAALKGLAAGTVNLSCALVLGQDLPAATALLSAGLLGLLGYGLSLVCFIYALRHLGAARTGAYFSLAPFVGALLGIALLGEAVTIPLAAAGLLMAIGLYLHLAERHAHDHRHDEQMHEHAHCHDEHHQHSHGAGDPLGEPHVHWHRHTAMVHRHPHYPDIHHRHTH